MSQLLPAWAEQYIGIPFVDLGRDRRGADCWGLDRLILQEQAGLSLPEIREYEGTERRDADRIEALINEHKAMGDWAPLDRGSERLFDGMLMKFWGQPIHTGLVLAPGIGIHTLSGSGSRLIEYRLPKHKHIILGFFRHRALA